MKQKLWRAWGGFSSENKKISAEKSVKAASIQRETVNTGSDKVIIRVTF